MVLHGIPCCENFRLCGQNLCGALLSVYAFGTCLAGKIGYLHQGFFKAF